MSLIDHLEKLKYFNKLYGFKSLKEASKIIGISQVGLSKNLTALESALNTQLVVRNQSGIRFTSEGERLYEFSSKLIDSTLLFQSSIKGELSALKPISLTLETYDSIAVYFIPEFFGYIKPSYTNVSINVKIDHSRNIMERLNKGQIDLAIGVNLDIRHSNYQVNTFFNDTYSCYVCTGVKNDLNCLPIIVHPTATDRDGKLCRTYLDKALKKRQSILSENFETIKSLTLRSVGIGVLPRNVAAQELRSGRLVQVSLSRIPEAFGTHDIRFAYNKKLAETHQDLLNEMIRIGNSWSNRF